jgi:hypothetical protein
MERNEWSGALEALERAADFASVSSDISMLLALARRHEDRPCGAVLEALERALETGRWKRYSPGDARLLEAEILVRLRRYSGALRALALVPPGEEEARIRLLALKGLGDTHAFLAVMEESLDRYPGDARIARILLEYAPGLHPGEREERLMSLVLRRLPLLLESDGELACAAAPFIRNPAEAGRMVAAYRAAGGSRRGGRSLPAALNLGLVDDGEAAAEFFADAGTLDKALILDVFNLLRSEEGKDLFNRNLLAFSGVIVEDGDADGFYESRASYRDGELLGYRYDADQDGLPELVMIFSGQLPDRAEQLVLPEAADSPAPPVRDEDRIKAKLVWDRYPAVLSAEIEDCFFIPRPMDYFFNPVRLAELCGTGTRGGLVYPEIEEDSRGISRRSLVSFALQIRRPSAEFEGAEEVIDLDRGVPRRAVEILRGRVVSRTDFVLGSPALQRIDLDLDGRMETLRRFAPQPPPSGEEALDRRGELVFTESDWNGDGRYETAEEYFPGGKRRSYMDMDGDGLREYFEDSEE